MLNIWFTADFHLGHKNISWYCNRPFDTVEEMNRTILDRLNNLAKANDLVLSQGLLHRSKSKGRGVTPRDSMQEGIRCARQKNPTECPSGCTGSVGNTRNQYGWPIG